MVPRNGLASFSFRNNIKSCLWSYRALSWLLSDTGDRKHVPYVAEWRTTTTRKTNYKSCRSCSFKTFVSGWGYIRIEKGLEGCESCSDGIQRVYSVMVSIYMPRHTPQGFAAYARSSVEAGWCVRRGEGRCGGNKRNATTETRGMILYAPAAVISTLAQCWRLLLPPAHPSWRPVLQKASCTTVVNCNHT